MAETRKSDFTGDVYGEWQVSGRAPAQNKKRAWHVVNGATGETRVVLQTELPELGAVGVPIESPWTEGVVALTAVNSFFHEDADPFRPTFVEADLDDMLDEQDEPTLPAIGSAALTAGPGECQHGIDIKTCPEHWTMLGERSKEAHEKYPQKFKGAAEITASVLAGNGKTVREKFTNATLDTTDGVMDWSHHLEPGEARSEPEDVDVPVLLGEHADEGVTEAQLDDAAQALPKDPVRAAVRKAMGDLFDYKNQIEAIHAQLSVAHEQLSGLMDSVDGILKAAVTK